MKASIFFLIFLAASALAGSYSLFTDSFNLDTGTYRYIRFRITPEQAENTIVSGSFTVEPDSTLLEFILISETDYRSGWEGRGDIDTLGVVYALSGPVEMSVPDFGDFVLIVSNRGNYNPVSFSAGFTVSYGGTGITYDSLPFAMTLLMTILASGVVVAAVVLTLKRISFSRSRG